MPSSTPLLLLPGLMKDERVCNPLRRSARAGRDIRVVTTLEQPDAVAAAVARMRRLAAASEALKANSPPTLLDVDHGTLEVRRTARVFNAMASRLHAQFDSQALLMAAISPDLRTPLARLRLRLAAMAPDPLAQRGIADVREVDTLIGSVLGLLREQHAPTEPVRIDLTALVRALVDDLADQGQPATFAAVAPERAPLVVATSSALKRIVANPIGNALRYGGSARIRVRAAEDEVRVEVDDEGPGIPVEQLGAVREPFRRGLPPGSAPDAPDHGLKGGHGLGLYIARDLAERVGGRIVLCNRFEGGLRATLQLPAASFRPTRDRADCV